MAELSEEQALLKAKFYRKNGNIAEAQKMYEAVLKAFPRNKKAQQSLSTIKKLYETRNIQNPPQEAINQLTNLYNQGQLSAVIEEAQTLAEHYPCDAFIWNIWGASAAQIAKLDQAVFAFQKVISLKPDYFEAYNNMGNALTNQGKLDAAIEAYKAALLLNPDYADAYNNMGIALTNQGKLDEAIEAYKAALSLKPDYVAAYNNMGAALRDQGKLDEAIEACKKVLALNPDYADAYNNMGVTLKEQGKLDEAIQAYKTALSLQPDNVEAHYNLSFAFLSCGNLKDGLDEYEWRWKTSVGIARKRHFLQPLWDGKKSLKGKRILLWCEQGIGDTINWSSCISHLVCPDIHCILECQEKLVPLLARSFPNVEVKPENRSSDLERDDFDYHLPMGSLYKHYFTKVSQYPKTPAFLVPDPVRVRFWRQRLKSLGKGPYVGISWKSSNITPARLPNYAPISDWFPVLTLPDITFINLQYKDFTDDLEKIQNEFGVTVNNFDDLDHSDDLIDVAALSAALDIVISIKNTVPFLSAGVGTLTKLATWRQSDLSNILLNPAGPLVNIFEKNTLEPWDNVFSLIAADLVDLKMK